MRVPLDYYRILGLPIQATAEQIQQSHRDRTLQLPRREYSEAAIAARKQLIDEAYAVLSDSEQRHAYDGTFLTKSYEIEGFAPSPAGAAESGMAIASDADPYTPSIEVDDHELVGALLILLELGEYELVLKLGRPYLTSGNATLTSGRFGQPEIVLSDIVLTLAFACLELGREQWQQGQYENAAESLQTGQDLLLQEGLFAAIRGEMQADLFKLRPYRILELLALSEENKLQRQRGLNLLQDMLHDRGGMDGAGDDRSGLNVDDFLRFVQQLRSYLTAAEQQTLFDAEARRPSAVATYLAVYALLARGFAERQPALIRRAKLMLIRLGTRQDVHLEQAVCALLLGQTEEASHALELSQEFESIAFIREHSQGSPDLLPGLCLYAERWLQNEVFPHFQDLATWQASLKHYFADEHVQAYLEELPNEVESLNQWAPAVVANGRGYGRPDRREAREFSEPQFGATAVATATRTAPDAPFSIDSSNTPMPEAERVSHVSTEDSTNGGAAMPVDGGRSTRLPHAPSSPRRSGATGVLRSPLSEPLPSRRIFSNKRRGLRLDRLVFLLAAGVSVVGGLIFLGGRLTQASADRAPKVASLQQFSPTVQRASAPFETVVPASTSLTNETAKQLVETWLAAKAAAMSESHDTSKLSEILIEPALTRWQSEADRAKADNAYVQYKHQVKQATVLSSAANATQTEVNAEVAEAADFYADGQPAESLNYDETLQVRYVVVRQNDRWLIQEMGVQ